MRYGRLGRATVAALSVPALVVVALSGPATPARAASSAGVTSSDLEGVWHVLIHEMDAPERAGQSTHASKRGWRWQDRIWVFRRDPTGHLVWTEHPIVRFRDETGRFTDLGTNMAKRVPGAWEPSPRQQREIETGLQVLDRGARTRRLGGSDDAGWRSLREEDEVAQSAESFTWSTVWMVDGLPEAPVFEVREQLASWGKGGEGGEGGEGGDARGEAAGFTRFSTVAFEDGVLSGRYERDGTRVGRFRMQQSSVLAIPEGAEGVIELDPEIDAGLGLMALLALFRYRYYHEGRRVELETTPTGAALELVYLRVGTQLLYRKGRAPLVVSIPSRIRTDRQDVIRVRAFREGFERQTLAFAADAIPERVVINLEPLPNELVAVGYASLPGRVELSLLTTEPVSLRGNRSADAQTLVLSRTAISRELGAHVAALGASPLGAPEALQVGEDLLLRWSFPEATPAGAIEARTLQAPDPGRGLQRTVLVLTRAGAEARRVEQTREAIGRLTASLLSRCALTFDARLREGLDPLALQRALAPASAFPGATLRATMRRLGEISPQGRVQLDDGRRLAVASPLELEVAIIEAHRVTGYLALLRALVAELEAKPRRETALRGLVAPESAPSDFARVLASARESERACRAHRVSAAVGGLAADPAADRVPSYQLP